MARIFPFPALVPPSDRAAQIASVPYDVVDTAEARRLAAGNPLSFLHVVRPEIDLPAETDPHDDAVYARGRENLERFLRDAPYGEEPGSLFVYRLILQGRAQTGLVACCAIDEYDDDRIRKHERTRRDKEDDRTRHVLEMRCQAEPIFLAYRGREDVDELVAASMTGVPLFDFRAPDGVGHTVWRCREADPIVEAFQRVPLLYVADGHHRAASASRARAALRDGNPGHGGGEEYNRVLAVLFPARDLRILPYNRVVADLGGRTPEAFLEELDAVAEVTRNATPTPTARGHFRLCLREDGRPRWYAFRLSPPPSASVVDALDAALLQERVLRPLLGVDDPRTSDRIDFVGGSRGVAELERRVSDGRAAAAFSLYPTSIEELMAVADAGGVMPPKSTWFEPKLRSGLFLHRI